MHLFALNSSVKILRTGTEPTVFQTCAVYAKLIFVEFIASLDNFVVARFFYMSILLLIYKNIYFYNVELLSLVSGKLP